MKGVLRSYERFLRLGHGGMAEVWLSVCKGPAGFRKLLVIKQLHADLAQDPMFVSMFLDEARLAAELSHPNIVQTVEVGEHGNEHYIVMEYLEGQTLSSIRKRAWLPLEMELAVFRDLLRALEYAHDLRGLTGTHLGVVHRDISPDNIFVTYDGMTKLMDFGVAKAASSRTRSRVGMFKGKPMYMAPEQVRGDAVDRRSDLFAIGVLLGEALCRRSLWEDATDLGILRELNRGSLPGLPESIREQEPELSKICAQAMSIDPSVRFVNAREFHDALAEHMKRRTRGFGDVRLMGEYVSQKFAEERLQRRLAIEEELLKVRSRGTSETVVAPPRVQRESRPISKRGSIPASLRVPAKLTLRRRIVGSPMVQYEAVYGPSHLPVLVEIHDDVNYEEIQGRVRSLCQGESPVLQRLIDCGATLGASGIYVVRELPAGRPLSEVLAEGQTMHAADAVDLIAEVARSLLFVHGRGLAHGALEPGSIFLEQRGLCAVKVKGVPLFVDRALSPSDDVFRLFEMLFQLIVGTAVPVGSANLPKVIRDECPGLFELLYRGLNPNHPWRSAGAVLNEICSLRREELMELQGQRRMPISIRSAELPRPLSASRVPTNPQEKPNVWVIINDPAFRDPVVRAGIDAIERHSSVTYFDESACARLAQDARAGELKVPSVVIFGDLDVLVSNPTLKILRDTPEVCRLVISSHAHAEMLQETANEMGLDQQVALPCTVDDVVSAVAEALERSTRLRRGCNELRASLLQARMEGSEMSVGISRHRSERGSDVQETLSPRSNYGVA